MKPLEEALAWLRQEFPGETIYEATVSVRKGERSDHPGVAGLEREWSDVTWKIQVSGDSEYGSTLENAMAKVRRRRVVQSEVLERAERIAAILREIPDESFDRERVVMAARTILDNERSGR